MFLENITLFWDIDSHYPQKTNNKLIKLGKEDKFYPIKSNSLNAERLSSLEAAEDFDKKREKI